MLPWPSRSVSDNPLHTLWHYAHGRMPDWVNGSEGEVAWIKREHRGIQWLDKIQLPKKSQHLKYILQPKFTIKFDTAFDQVVPPSADRATVTVPEVARSEATYKIPFELHVDELMKPGKFGTIPMRVFTVHVVPPSREKAILPPVPAKESLAKAGFGSSPTACHVLRVVQLAGSFPPAEAK